MKLAGLQLKAETNAVYTFVVMVIALVVVTVALRLATGNVQTSSFVEALVVALAAATFHFVAQFIHMVGHALAAWAVGYPKCGMLFIYGFAMSLYPPDEPILPDRIHIQRSLGGVAAFGLLLLIVLVFWLSARNATQWTVRYLATYMLVNIVLLFTVSALVTDGVLFIFRKEWRSQPPDASISL